MLKYKGIILYILIVIIGFVWAVVTLKPNVLDIYHIETEIKQKRIDSANLESTLQDLKTAEISKKSLKKAQKPIYSPTNTDLDTESVFSSMFDNIIQMAKNNGIKIYSIEYDYNPSEDEFVKQAGARYNVCQLKMEIISDYPDLESFLREVLKYSYLVNIDSLELSPYGKNKRFIITNLVLKLYAEK